MFGLFFTQGAHSRFSLIVFVIRRVANCYLIHAPRHVHSHNLSFSSFLSFIFGLILQSLLRHGFHIRPTLNSHLGHDKYSYIIELIYLIALTSHRQSKTRPAIQTPLTLSIAAIHTFHATWPRIPSLQIENNNNNK